MEKMFFTLTQSDKLLFVLYIMTLNGKVECMIDVDNHRNIGKRQRKLHGSGIRTESNIFGTGT